MCCIEGNCPFQLMRGAICNFFGEFQYFASPHSPIASSRKKTPALVGQSPRDKTYNSPMPRRQGRISIPFGQSSRDQAGTSPKPRRQGRINILIGQSPRDQADYSPMPRHQGRINILIGQSPRDQADYSPMPRLQDNKKRHSPHLQEAASFLHAHKILIYYILLRYRRSSVRVLHVCRPRRLRRRMHPESSLPTHFQQRARRTQ